MGLSFRQIAAVIKQHASKYLELSGLNNHMVGQFVRVLVGINLQQMKLILSNPTVWSFALTCDGLTHNVIPSFEVRIQNRVNGNLYNLHLVVVPFFDRHTVYNTVNLIKTLLDNMCKSWRDKVMTITTDGKRKNTGCRNGVVARLDRMATHKLMRNGKRRVLQDRLRLFRALAAAEESYLGDADPVPE